MTFSFHPEALDEYREATSYYNDVSPALASSFVREVEQGIERILEHPLAWPLVEEDLRRHLIDRFPFGIYFTIESNDEVFIVAVMHMSRKSAYWKERTR